MSKPWPLRGKTRHEGGGGGSGWLRGGIGRGFWANRGFWWDKRVSEMR